MNTCLYLSNDALMKLEASEELSLDGSRFTMKQERWEFELKPAVRFLKVVSGDDDELLLGKVWSKPELLEKGAEHYSDSVLFGDVAYEVEEGFLGVPVRELRKRKPTDPGEPSDGELIARFLTGQG